MHLRDLNGVVFSPYGNEDPSIFVMAKDSSQLQILDLGTLELKFGYISLNQELIEFAYDNDAENIEVSA